MAGPVNPTSMSWTAPQVNTNGSELTNLSGYNIYLGPTNNGPWSLIRTILAWEANPIPGRAEVVAISTFGPLADGQYYGTVEACNILGVCSIKAVPSPFVWGTVNIIPEVATNIQFQ